MAAPRVPLKRIFGTAAIVAIPGLLTLAGASALDAIRIEWLAVGMIVCILLAGIVGYILGGDLTAVAAYGDGLSHDPDTPEPRLSGWGPAARLASLIRRLAREARRREQMLTDAMNTRQLVLDGLPQPILLLDHDRRILSINRATRKLIGINPVGNDLSSAIRDPKVLEIADTALRDGEPKATNVTISDPVERYYSIQAVPLEGLDHGEPALLIVLVDLTERRRAEQMRSDFIANVSHELRTPLASLIGFIETLQGPAKDDEEARERFLALMASQAGRMGRLVQDLLSLSAIELVEHTRPEDRIDLAATLGSVIAGLELEAKAKDMVIRRKIDPDLPAALGNGDQLAQLLLNLIDNAIKYGRAGSTVTVSLHFSKDIPGVLADIAAQAGAPGVIRIDVTDEGEGIASEHIPRLTERFYRVDTARSRAIGGTGLGLAIVKHILSHHRGFLEISSTQGEGSTFSATLLAAPEGVAAD
jgi:two-component system phosphate regulon sensor histidine kinase PhoR